MMECVALERMDQAKSLLDCVYAVYGLTFHRDYVYYPERVIELNRRGYVRSFLAVEDGRVVGHLAWIRPFFELTRDGQPICDDRIGEAGLSIVLPSHRGKHVQTALAMTIAKWAYARGCTGAFMKCVTNHVFSQKTSANMGGRPLALYLAGIPKFVVYDNAPAERQDPLSTVLFYTVFHPAPRQPLCLPRSASWLANVVGSTGLVRDRGDGGPLEEGPTDLEVEFVPSKRLAQVHVLHAGADLLERVGTLNRWLLDGHMEHVSWYFPAGSPRVQRTAEEFATAGLFCGGWIPGLHAGARDALLYQSIKPRDLDGDAVQVHGAVELKERVVAGWRTAQASLVGAG